MNTNDYSIAFSEVLDVLQHSEIDIIEKIPLEIIKNIKEKSSKEYVSNITEDNDFYISDKAKSILAVLYQDYLCDDEEKAKEFSKKLIENEEKYQEKLREEFNPNNIFKKKDFKSNNNISENMQMIEYKESIFKKIFNKIKMWFK